MRQRSADLERNTTCILLSKRGKTAVKHLVEAGWGLSCDARERETMHVSGQPITATKIRPIRADER